MLNLSRAKTFHDGENVFLIADAAGNGSPIGGLGISLVTSVYMDALATLVGDLTSREDSDIPRILGEYDTRVRKIIDFWHFSLKK